MKDKLVRTVFFITMGGILLLSAYQMDDDPEGEAGATGAPGEVTCADSTCHTSYEVNSGPGSVSVSSPDLLNWDYVPGESYTINVTVSHQFVDLFGLGFVALKSNGDNAGTLIAGTDNQIKLKNVEGFIRRNIVHDEGTGNSQNAHTFSFIWEAPTTNVGDVTFYFAGNAANDDGEEINDYIYTNSQVVSAPVGIYELHTEHAELAIYPNPASDVLNIRAQLSKSGEVSFRLIDANGSMVMAIPPKDYRKEPFSEMMNLQTISSGMYMLQLYIDGQLAASEKLNVR